MPIGASVALSDVNDGDAAATSVSHFNRTPEQPTTDEGDQGQLGIAEKFANLVKTIMSWYQHSLVGGIITRYTSHRGALMANGLAYGLLFAFFAGVWLIVSVFGLIVSGNEQLQNYLVQAASSFIPAVGDDFFSEDVLSRISSTLTWTGLVTLVLFWWTVVGWMDSLRNAVKIMFDAGEEDDNPVVTKLRDTGAALLIAVLFLFSTLSIGLSGGVVRNVMELLDISTNTVVGSLLLDILAMTSGVLLNLALVALLFFIVAHVKVSRYSLIGALLAAIAISVMQILGARLLGGASKNPLLAPFAAVIGVLIWFNLIAQVVLICAAFIAECEFRYIGDKAGSDYLSYADAEASAVKPAIPVGEASDQTTA